MIKKLALTCLFAAIPTMNALAANNAHHYPAIFIGTTTADSKSEFSYGFEYEYKFNKLWGAGVVYEKTDDAHHGDGVDVYLASAYLHPWKDLRIGAGFGKEKVGGHHSFTEDLARISVSYDFHFAGIGVAPTLAVDFVDGETATVAGVAFVFAF